MNRENKIKFVRITVIIVLLFNLCAVSYILFAQAASSIVDKAAHTFEKAGGMSADFSMQITVPGQSGMEQSEGAIEMQGDKFVLTTPEMQTFFNGTTQWVYLSSSDEVNISNPSGEELQLINPALLLKTYKSGFTATSKGSGVGVGSKVVDIVELTPRIKKNIVMVELQVLRETSLPSAIIVKTKNGSKTTILISNVKTGINKPDSYFVFREADFPGVEMIDLR